LLAPGRVSARMERSLTTVGVGSGAGERDGEKELVDSRVQEPYLVRRER